MSNKPALTVVPKPVVSIPFDDARGKKLIESSRAKLLAACIRYVNESQDREGFKRPDRIRIASDASGIPRMQIEAGAK